MKLLYLLLITISLLGCVKKGAFEKEPNNSFSLANRLEFLKEISGYIDTKEDRDFYRIDAEDDKR